MSFKRDGDNPQLFKALQHQRVCDILGDNIPVDEALLLKNGRLCCTICYKRPIFDTIPMLANHRKGKKHLLELTKYLERKVQLENKSLKLAHSNEISDETTSSSPSANSYVRKYLKKLPRKMPFEKKVAIMRENYGQMIPSMITRSTSTVEKSVEKKERSSLPKGETSRRLQLLESGWLQRSDGQWYQNPDVEFDSDDETPMT